MPYDLYDMFRKIISDNSLKESEDIVRENIWNDAQDVYEIKKWQYTEDKVRGKWYMDLRYR